MDCIAHQAPLSMGLSRQESWSGCHCPQTFLVLQAFLGTPSNCPSHLLVTVSQVAAGFSLLFFPSTIFQGAANPDGYHLSKHKAHPSGTLYPAWICNQIHGGPMDSVSYQIQCCKSYLVLQKKQKQDSFLGLSWQPVSCVWLPGTITDETSQTMVSCFEIIFLKSVIF